MAFRSFKAHFDTMVLKQKQTNFFVLEASKKIIPKKAFFIDVLPLPEAPNRRLPTSLRLHATREGMT